MAIFCMLAQGENKLFQPRVEFVQDTFSWFPYLWVSIDTTSCGIWIANFVLHTPATGLSSVHTFLVLC